MPNSTQNLTSAQSSMIGRQKKLGREMVESLKIRQRREKIKKENAELYKTLSRERGYRQIEKDTGKKVQRFNSKTPAKDYASGKIK
jgi:hypothetical protein